MSMTTKQLEQLAIDAHSRGVSWCEFWADHAAKSPKPPSYPADDSHTVGAKPA
jgi:hypothetical protein